MEIHKNSCILILSINSSFPVNAGSNLCVLNAKVYIH